MFVVILRGRSAERVIVLKLYSLACPYCEGNLEIKLDSNKEIFCPYCGRKFLVGDGKQTININIDVNKKSQHTRHYVDEAEVIRAKNEHNESKFAFLIVCTLLVFGLLIFGLIKIGEVYNHNKSIHEMAEGKICAGSSYDYEEQNYEAVLEQFEIMGFENIQTVDLDDAGLFKNKRDTVDSVRINGQSFGDNDYFYPTDQVVIKYH